MGPGRYLEAFKEILIFAETQGGKTLIPTEGLAQSIAPASRWGLTQMPPATLPLKGRLLVTSS